MKRILLAITAILALAACNKDIIVPEIVTDSENVVLDFSVVVPEAQTATKAFSDTPVITGLKVFVFDQNSLLLKAVDATIADDQATTDKVEFTVTLPQHPSACSVHFVANCPATTNIMSEADMTSLVTSDTQDAYWQRIAVDNLIASNETLKTALEAKFNKIPLIRNFAKVTVELADGLEGFKLEGYTLINVPTSGTVVPYNTEEGEFESYNTAGTGLDYAALKANHYNGFMPAGVQYNTTVPAAVTSTSAIYTYESKAKEKNNTALIVYGTYTADNGTKTSGYYKVDFLTSDDKYYDILRNLHYKVTINNVLGAGYPTAAAAAEAAAGNNISASTDTKNLLNISDGTSRLFVDEIVKHVVTSQAFTIKFRYEPTINGTPSNGSAVVTRSKEGATDAVINSFSVATADGSDGWRTITITPKDLPAAGSVYIEELTIKAGHLSRTVTLYLHQPYAMSVACTPTTASAVKTAVTVNTTIPTGLPVEIFPLVFDMEDTQLCLSPDASKTNVQGSLPVTTETSIINASKETFHYKRTLTLEQYNALTAGANGKTFSTYFVTNKAVSGITVYVKNELFGVAAHN